MKTGIVLIFALFLLCGSPVLYSQTLFTWTDEDGVVHISDGKPPEGTQIENKLHYQKQPRKSPLEIKENQKKRQTDREKSEAVERAEIEKRKANIAKQKAEEAYKKANQINKEADEFIQKVKYKSRKAKSLRVKMKRRLEEANRAIAEAQKLKQLAIEAEKKAKDAESKAKKLKEETTNEP